MRASVDPTGPARRRRPAARAAAAALGLLLATGATTAPAQDARRRPAPLEGGFAARLAQDLSGIACRGPARGGAFDCLVVNDESSFAQRATYRDGRLRPGAPVPLIGEAPPAPGEAAGDASAIGTCRDGTQEFGEFDGEGIAWLPGQARAGTYFLVGSHACGRNAQRVRLRPSTHLIARIEVDASGRFAPPALSSRLGPALRAAPVVGGHYNQPLTPAGNGLDIEGVAAAGDRLFFGLRAPSIGGHAHVLVVPAAAVFDRGAPADRPVPMAVGRIPLGPDAGIRDIAALPGGRLLVLSGPAQDQEEVPFGLHLVTPPASPGAQAVGDWPLRTLVARIAPPEAHPGAKAEGLAVLEADGREARLLVLYEDPRAGGAWEYRVALRPR
jgi:hypothetical protein